MRGSGQFLHKTTILLENTMTLQWKMMILLLKVDDLCDRIEDADEDYDAPGTGQVIVENEDGTVTVQSEGEQGDAAAAVPPLTPFRVCTASMPLPVPPPLVPEDGDKKKKMKKNDTPVEKEEPPSCPRLFCVLPSPHAKARADTIAERTVLGGGFMEVSFQWKNVDFLMKNVDFLLKNVDFIIKQEDSWRGDTFQIHLLCEVSSQHSRILISQSGILISHSGILIGNQ